MIMHAIFPGPANNNYNTFIFKFYVTTYVHDGVVIINTTGSPLPIELVATTENV